MDVIVNSISHSMLQLGVGMSAGVFVDWLSARFIKMRTPGTLQSVTDAALELLEVSAQVTVGAVIVGSVVSYLASLDIAVSDPSHAFGYLLARSLRQV